MFTKSFLVKNPRSALLRICVKYNIPFVKEWSNEELIEAIFNEEEDVFQNEPLEDLREKESYNRKLIKAKINATLSECKCGCGQRVKGLNSEFIPGHWHKRFFQIDRVIKGELEIEDLKPVVKEYFIKEILPSLEASLKGD